VHVAGVLEKTFLAVRLAPNAVGLRLPALSGLREHAPGLSASFCEVARGGNFFIARTVRRSRIVVKKVSEGMCGVYGVVRAGGRGHERP